MAQQPPIFTDVGAYGRNVPGNAQVPNAAPVYEAVGDVAGAAMKLGQVFYQQDQEKAVLDAKISMTQGFQALRQKAAQETDIAKLNQAFEEESAKIEAAVTANALDGRTANAIRADFAAQSQAAQADVFRRSMALRSSEYVASADKLAEQLYQGAPLDADRHLTASKAQIQEQADAMARLGHLAPDKAADWRLHNLRRLDDGRATWDVKNAPKYALSLLEANKDGEWLEYTDLDVKRREVLIAQAKAGNGQNSANVNEWINTGVNNIIEGKGDGESERKQVMALGASKAQVDDMNGRFQAGNDMRAALDVIRSAPLSEQERLISEFSKRTTEGPNRQYYAPFVANLRTAVDGMNRKMREDFPSWAHTYFGNEGHKKMPLEDRISWYRAVAQQKGVEGEISHWLPKEEAAAITKTYMGVGPDMQQAIARDVITQSGRHSGDVVRQLLDKGDGGGKMPFDFVAMLEVDAHTASKISAAQRMSAEALKKLYPSDKEANVVLNEARAKFDAEIGRTIPDASPEYKKGWQDTYIRLSLYERDAAAAYKGIWGKHTVVNLGSTAARIPDNMQDYQKEKVSATAGYLLRQPKEIGVLTDLPTSALSATMLQINGGWMTYSDPNGQDAGLKLYYNGRPALDTTGKEITRTWADLLEYQPKDETDWRLARGKYPKATRDPNAPTGMQENQEFNDRLRRQLTGARY